MKFVLSGVILLAAFAASASTHDASPPGAIHERGSAPENRGAREWAQGKGKSRPPSPALTPPSPWTKLADGLKRIENERKNDPFRQPCPPMPMRRLDRLPFGPGEKVVYRVDALGVYAGVADLRTGKTGEKNGTPVIPVKAVAKPNSFFMKLRPTNGYTLTFLDVNTILPVTHETDVVEVGERKVTKVEFNRKNRRYSGDYIRGQNQFHKDEAMPARMSDGIAIFYHFRLIDLKPGLEVCYEFIAGLGEWRVRGKVTGSERVQTFSGIHDSWKVEGMAVQTNISTPNRPVKLWITKDEKQLPVKIETAMLWGNVTTTLQDYREAPPGSNPACKLLLPGN
ncbi:MAG: hypothetical protein GMKNLPBB_00921 [Myxococcota bacterium]|nr:hypothetical protein [Myxococcota bacterium]